MNTAQATEGCTHQELSINRQGVLAHLRIMKRSTAFQGNPDDFDSPEYHDWMQRDDAYTESREELLRRLAAYNQQLGLPAASMD